MYNVFNWVGNIVQVLLGGELYTSVVLTWLQRHASRHHHSITCHVSEIQKGADISRCHLSGHHNPQCSDSRNNDDADYMG